LTTLGLLVACRASDSALPGEGQPDAGASPEPTGQPATPPVTLRVATGQPPGPLDPARVSLSDVTGYDLVDNLYVGLTELDPATNSVQPALATTWTVSPDGLRWNFTLRDDVTWVAFDPAANAVTALRPVTADDVVHAIHRACHPATDAPQAAILFVIRGCREVNNTDPAQLTGQTLADTIGARADSPTSVTIELERQAAPFLSLTALPILRPVAPEAFADEGAEWRDGGLMASSGPWVIAGEDPGQSLTLVANPEWPFEREGEAGAVEVHFAPGTALVAFQSGAVDAATLPDEEAGNASLLRAEPRVTFLAFASDQFPMDEVRVRRALAAAIDRERIVDRVLNGDGLPTAGFVPPGMVAAPPTAGQPAATFNVDFARQQMAGAGYPRCQLFPRVTLAIDESAQSKALAEALVRMWQDNLGCNDTRFDVQPTDMRLLLESVNTPLAADWQTRPHITLLTWQADYPDAHNWLADVLHCEQGYLQLGRSCDVVDDLMERAARENNPDARAALYAETEALLFDEDGLQPIAPIYTHVQPLAVAPGVELPAQAPARFDRWQIGGAE
jgi:ABC-type oligopeptide transport system substrate-binding subunit